MGSPNVESERIVRTITDSGAYYVPIHEFAKAALLGEYSHFQEESSSATNLFSVVYRDQREHFLSLLILGFLSWDGAPTSQTDGFVSLDALSEEMQRNGFIAEQIQAHVLKLTRRKLIETTERRLLETADEVKELGFPEAYRISSVGAYHLKRWVSEFSYLEAMSFDTPIFSEIVRASLLAHVNDDRLSARYQRSLGFRDYLDSVWGELTPKPYFDWAETRKMSSSSFSRVERSLRDMGLM